MLANGLIEATDRLAQANGLTGGLTSYALLSQGDSDAQASTSVLVETLLGAVGALAVLVFVFASFLAFVPLLVAAVSILTTFLLVLLLTTVTDVSFVVQFLISLVGLGVAIDYSLLLVSRWREERAHGLSNDEAVVVAVKTAGHAVLASGVTVAISLVALVVVPVPLLRSMGLGGMLIPLVSVSVVLTLLPTLLSKVGPKIDYPRIRHEGVAARGWSRWARAIVRRRFLAAGVALVALAVLASPVLGLKIDQASTTSLARGGPAYEALAIVDDGVGTGVLTPIVVLVRADQAEAAVRAVDGVDGVLTAALGGRSDGSAVVQVVPSRETVDSDGTAVVERVRQALRDSVDGEIAITGAGATVEDYGSAVYDNFTFWLPVLIFAFLFGLSMDYEVFILARMREEFDATGSTSAAVVTGIGRTGRLVTSAALILFFAFGALATAPGTDIKVLGTALGVGVLIDATLVRALLVPALVSAFGRYN